MALSDDEQATLKRLNTRLNRDIRGCVVGGQRQFGFLALDAYFNGVQRLEQLGLAVPEDLRQFVTIVAWPATYIGALEERIDLEGFRLPGQSEADTDLGEIWQANDLDAESPMAHLDSLVFGRAYGCVGTNEDTPEIPLITVESPYEMIHEWSSRERRVTSAGRFYEDTSGSKTERFATLYLPTETIWCERGSRGQWVDYDRDDSPARQVIDRVPVEPLVNRGRLHDRYGQSEMTRIITLTDAAARALTIAQLATELMGVPTRTAAGLTQADFTDPVTKERLTQWEAYLGSVWSTGNKDAKFHQFDAADLSNFTRIIDHYGQLVAGVTGLPLRYFGQATTNPPSEGSINADDTRIIKRCERKHVALEGSWERLMRTAIAFRDGVWDPNLANMETLWRDPATPTRAQSADASVKLYQAGVIPKRQTRRDLGYSNVQIGNMERDDADEADDPLIERVSRRLAGVDDAAAVNG